MNDSNYDDDCEEIEQFQQSVRTIVCEYKKFFLSTVIINAWGVCCMCVCMCRVYLWPPPSVTIVTAAASPPSICPYRWTNPSHNRSRGGVCMRRRTIGEDIR